MFGLSSVGLSNVRSFFYAPSLWLSSKDNYEFSVRLELILNLATDQSSSVIFPKSLSLIRLLLCCHFWMASFCFVCSLLVKNQKTFPLGCHLFQFLKCCSYEARNLMETLKTLFHCYHLLSWCCLIKVLLRKLCSVHFASSCLFSASKPCQLD